VQLSLEHQFDPVLDYLASLQWDRQPRLQTWMTRYLGAADNELIRAIGRLTLIAAVRRARSQALKFDQIVVLEGPEGKGKSFAIETLAGGRENFSRCSNLGTQGPRAAGSGGRRLAVRDQRPCRIAQSRDRTRQGVCLSNCRSRQACLWPVPGGSAAADHLHRHHQPRRLSAVRHRQPAFLASGDVTYRRRGAGA